MKSTLKKWILPFMGFLVATSLCSFGAGLKPKTEGEIAQELIQMKLIQGYEDGSLGLERNITRAEVVTILTRLLHPKAAENLPNPFNDIDQHWAKLNILKIQSLHLINGFEDGSFRPDKDISNAEILALTIRALQLENEVPKDLAWPENYLSYGKNLGFIEAEDTLHTATRGEVFKILYQALSYSLK